MTSSASEPSKIYVREASGMVREFGWLATLGVSGSVLAVGIAANLQPAWHAGIYPGSDVFTSLTLAVIPGIFFGLMYILFSMNMPRSGGDYIYISRIIHPTVGFMMNFAFTFWMIMFLGSDMAIIVSGQLSPALAGFALATSNSALLNTAGSMALSQNSIFIGGVVSLIIVVAILTLGSKYVARFLMIGFIIGIIGQLVVMGLYASANQATFTSSFNTHFAGVTNVTGVKQLATSNGWTFTPTSFSISLAALPFAYLWYLGYNYSAYVAGEVKQVKKSMFVSIFGALGIGWLVYSVSILLFNRVVPYDFEQAVAYLFFAAPSAYPLPALPGSYLWAGLLTNNAIIAFIPLLGMVFWAFMFPVAVGMVVTRNIFAWSFDRVAPRFFSDINRRSHSPIKTILVFTVVALVFLYIFVYTTIFTLLVNAILALSLAYIIPGIAAVVYPYVKKEQYEKSPAARYKIGKLPVIVICGVVSIGYYLFLSYAAYTTSGVCGCSSPSALPALGLIALSFVIAPIIYFIARSYHIRKEAVDISMAFKEVPPG